MHTPYDPAAARRRVAQELGSLLTLVALTPFALLPSRHAPRRARDQRTLVFVHGLGGNRANFFPLQAYLRWHGYRRQLSFNYRTSGSIEKLAIQLDRRLKDEVKGGRIDLVCHSLGGVVARTWLQMLGGDRRVDRMITLGSPHQGTHGSTWLPTSIGSQLHPESPFIQRLNSLPPPEGVTCTSIAGGKDLLVMPPSLSHTPFGDNITYDDLGHLDMMLSPRVLRLVRRRLEATHLLTDSAMAEATA